MKKISKEAIVQIILILTLFIGLLSRKDTFSVGWAEVSFFLTYVAAALFVGYVLLPRFFYTKRFIAFFLGVLGVVTVVVFAEEFILEKIFYPTKRGSYFPGYIVTLLQILPVILILVGFKFAWDAYNKQRAIDELQSIVKESELQFLKSQINPHFLFNNLNNLYAYAIENSPKTPTIILELSSVLRYMLYECKEDFVPISKEIEQLENFTRLSELQIEERGKIVFTKDITSTNYRIAPLILIVFIENAFKHSQASQSNNIYIAMDLKVEENGILNFKCVNNYQKQSNTTSLSNGIGLKNVKKRLELLYPNAHQLTIKMQDNQYEVHLMLQLHKTSDL